jgi:hypothetical protein
MKRTGIVVAGAFAAAVSSLYGQQGSVPAKGQDARQFVARAVQNELSKDANDHSHWLYFEVDQKPEHPVKQWVADTGDGSLKRVVQLDGRSVSPQEQQQQMDAYIRDSGARAKQRKSGAHDDEEAAKMLRMLPNSFLWTSLGEQGDNTLLHFRPDPNFTPPDMETKVFAAMEGDMAVNTKQMRIASLKGRLTHDVTFLGGLLGKMNGGGTFDVERRETGHEGVWQITESHIHINGHALLFKTISEQEDDVKTEFRQLPAEISLEQAKQDLLQVQPANQGTQASK